MTVIALACLAWAFAPPAVGAQAAAVTTADTTEAGSAVAEADGAGGAATILVSDTVTTKL